MTTNSTDQRRARAGGEFGANGEWYEGGKFIATQEHTVKRSPMVRTVTPEELARRAAVEAEHAAAEARLAARAEQFADLLAVLESEPRGTFETFWQSLARQIRATGSLSPKQARHASKAMFGRENNSNREAQWKLVEALTEDFN